MITTTEAAARGELGRATREHEAAQARLAQAGSALEKAQSGHAAALVELRRFCRLEDLAGHELARRVEAATAQDGDLDLVLDHPPALADLLRQRDAAAIRVSLAEVACKRLAGRYREAEEDADAATAALRRAMMRVMGFEAASVAHRLAAVRAEAAQLRLELWGAREVRMALPNSAKTIAIEIPDEALSLLTDFRPPTGPARTAVLQAWADLQAGLLNSPHARLTTDTRVH